MNIEQTLEAKKRESWSRVTNLKIHRAKHRCEACGEQYKVSIPSWQGYVQSLFRLFQHIRIALIAYKHTIIDAISVLWVSLNNPPSSFNFLFLAIPVYQMCGNFCTNSRYFVGDTTLFTKQVNNDSGINVCHDKPPENGWYQCNTGDYLYYRDGKQTGVIIFRTHSVLIPGRKIKHGSWYISLGKWFYRVSFYPNPDNIYEVYEVIESSSIKEAQKMGEWYYKKWLYYN